MQLCVLQKLLVPWITLLIVLHTFLKMCAEQLKALSKVPGVSGAHIIASNSVLNIPEAVTQSDI